MRGGGRRKGGTNIRREPDMAAIRDGLAGPGIDPRLWVARGTVAVVHDDGSFDYADPNAVVIAPRGIDVDVVIEPFDDPVTCRYGHQFGDVVMLFPIRPGNLVTVEFPYGDPNGIPEITKVNAGPHTPIPVESGDQKPVWRNDRALIAARGVPVELRALGDGTDVSLLVNPDGSIQLGKQAAQALIRGTAYRNAEAQENNGLSAALETLNALTNAMDPAEMALVPAPTVAAWLVAMKTFLPMWKQLLDQFEGGADGFLSQVSKTE